MNLIKDLEKTLQGNIEGADIHILGEDDEDPTLYVDFNDSFDNTLAVYIDGKGIGIANLRHLNSDSLKPVTEWSKKYSPKNLRELLAGFSECNKRVIREVQEFIDEAREIEQDALGPEYNEFASQLGPAKLPGMYASPAANYSI